jgi:hypothetical protein
MSTFLFYTLKFLAKLQRFRRSFVAVRSLAIGVLSVAGILPHSVQAGGVRLLGGLDFTALTFDLNSGAALTRYDRKLGGAFGLELDFTLNSAVDWVTGVNYRVRSYGLSTNRYSMQCLEVPLALRLYLGRAVAIQFGGYVTKGLGFMTVSYVPENSESAGYSNQLSFENMNLLEWDFGVMAGFHVVTDSPSRVALDLRYLQGMFNVQRLPNYVGTFSSFELLFSFPLLGAER